MTYDQPQTTNTGEWPAWVREAERLNAETSYAVIRDGKIVAGGNPCARCGKPTMSGALKDPFGKSSASEWLCDEHMPFRIEVKAQ